MKLVGPFLKMVVVLTSLSIFGSLTTAAADSGSGDTTSGNSASPGAPGSRGPKDISSPLGVIVRGWAIQSVTAIKRATVSEIYPEYVDKKPVGNHSESKKPSKDKYLVVLVQSQSADLQALNQPLWVGQPDVTLVDDVGFEYPALGRLVQLNGDYVTVGMVAGRNRPRGSRTTDNSLVYFDVPANTHTFWLKFSEGGPLIAVGQANDLPTVATE